MNENSVGQNSGGRNFRWDGYSIGQNSVGRNFRWDGYSVGQNSGGRDSVGSTFRSGQNSFGLNSVGLKFHWVKIPGVNVPGTVFLHYFFLHKPEKNKINFFSRNFSKF